MTNKNPPSTTTLPTIESMKANGDFAHGLTDDSTPLVAYKCDRCGYEYHKNFDFPPFLCYRCMRFIAKRVFTTMNTIQPPVSRPTIGDM